MSVLAEKFNSFHPSAFYGILDHVDEAAKRGRHEFIGLIMGECILRGESPAEVIADLGHTKHFPLMMVKCAIPERWWDLVALFGAS
jgi:hypothetical protein